MDTVNFILTALAALTSIACTVFLFRAYAHTGLRLLLWSSLAFVFLSINNVLLFLDMNIIPTIDLRVWRLSANVVAVLFLLYAFIWEVE